MFAISNAVSMRAIESNEFMDMLAAVRQLPHDLSLRGARTLIDKILPGADRVLSEVSKAKLQTPPCVCVTTDGWTTQSNSYCANITYHFIHEWTLQTHTADLVYLPSHDAQTAAALIKPVIHRNLRPDQVVAFLITDSCTCEILTAELLETDRWGCSDHALHNAILEAIRESSINVDIQLIQSIVTIVHGHYKLSAILQQLQELDGVMDVLAVILPVLTRWNSQYDMVARFLILYPYLTEMAKQGHFNSFFTDWPGTDFIARMKLIVELLAAFKQVSTIIESASEPTLCLVPGLLHGLYHKVAQRNADLDPPLAIQFKSKLKIALDKRYPDIFSKPGFALCAAALDPRQSLSMYCTQDVIDSTWEMLTNEAFSLTKDAPEDMIRSTMIEARRRVEEEARAPLPRDPLKFWASMKYMDCIHPLLHAFLACPASSAASERVFSNAGFVEENRTQLEPETLNMMVRLREHIKKESYNLVELVSKIEAHRLTTSK